MKRLILSCISATIISVLPCHAQNRLVSTANLGTIDNIHEMEPIRSVNAKTYSIDVSYKIPAMSIENDPLYSGCKLLGISGFNVINTPESPATLYGLDWFMVPDGRVAQVSIIESDYNDFPMILGPARQPLSDDNYEAYSLKNVMPIKAYSGLFPLSILELDEMQVYRGRKFQYVRINPIQYNYEARTVRIYSKISYRITFTYNPIQAEKDKIISKPDFSDRDMQVLGNVMNSAQMKISPLDTQVNDTTAYLIITTPKFMPAVKRLAELKQMFGYTTHISLRDSWTCETVQTVVEQAYNSMPKLRYLLIFGDYDDVPSYYYTYIYNNAERTFVSDYPYGCMDGTNDKLADLYRGRIPVSTLEEANSFIDKLMAYSLTPVYDKSFYNNVGACAYFQDNNSDGYADRRFAQTAEEISMYMESLGKNVNRIYYTSSLVNPTHWNKGSYSSGASIPNYLKRPQFNWDGDYSDIVNCINTGSFLVFHRDHGSEIGWADPKFYINDLSLLHNSNRYPVVFSINCESGAFHRSCFAEKMLKLKKAGCIGIVAATRISYSGYNDLLAMGMINSMWPNPGVNIDFPQASINHSIDKTANVLGEILDGGLFFMSGSYGFESTCNLTRRIFHCLGDPSMVVYKNMPVKFSNVNIERKDSIKVRISEPARITFVNRRTGDLKSYVYTSGNNHECIYDTNDNYVSVCISAEGKIPYVENGDDPNCIYIQNETLNYSKDFESENIHIGSSVSPNIATGKVDFKTGTFKLNAKKEIIIESETSIEETANMEILINGK